MDKNVLIGCGVAVGAIAFSALAVTLTNRFGAYATIGLGTLAIVASVVVGSRAWLDEPPELHADTPEVTRVTDWVAHSGMAASVIALPALVAVGLALAMRRSRSPVAAKIAIAAAGFVVAVGLGLTVMSLIADQLYRVPSG